MIKKKVVNSTFLTDYFTFLYNVSRPNESLTFNVSPLIEYSVSNGTVLPLYSIDILWQDLKEFC